MEKENLVILVFVIVLILALAGSMTYYYIEGPIEIIENENFSGDNSQLIGGCAGVHMLYWNECCGRVALEKGIVKPACVGKWVVEDNECKWECVGGGIVSESKIDICDNLDEMECAGVQEFCFQDYSDDGEYDKCLPLDYYSEHCIEEGEYFSAIPNSYAVQPKCCEGLESLWKVNLETNPDCEATTGGSVVCVKKDNCGNGECKEIENKCNCPEDCS